MAHQATGSVVAKKFAHAYEESERLAAELGMFQRENAMLCSRVCFPDIDDRANMQCTATRALVSRAARSTLFIVSTAAFQRFIDAFSIKMLSFDHIAKTSDIVCATFA